MCEAPLHPQNVPQASLRLADKLLCIVCGTANPPNMTSCVMCAANLLTDSKVKSSVTMYTIVQQCFVCIDIEHAVNVTEHNCRLALLCASQFMFTFTQLKSQVKLQV